MSDATRVPLPNPVTYWGIVYFGLTMMRLVRTTWSFEGTERFPRNGPVIVVGNHVNWYDPPLLIAAAPRRTIWLAKEELSYGWKGALLHNMVGWLNIKRGASDRAALRSALGVLRDGHPLGIFPEGTRSATGALKDAHPGAALLAFWSKAPVIPAAVTGTAGFRLPRDLFARRHFAVRFGEPFTVREDGYGGAARERTAQATQDIMARIAALLPEHMRGQYGAALDPVEDR